MPKQQVDEQAILTQAIQDLEPQVPIRSWNRDGRVIELHFADGRTIHYDWQSRETLATDQVPNLDNLLKPRLQELAKQAGIEGYSTMLKAELVQALEELR